MKTLNLKFIVSIEQFDIEKGLSYIKYPNCTTYQASPMFEFEGTLDAATYVIENNHLTKVIWPNGEERVLNLLPHQIFVFGANKQGIHSLGAALTAKEQFGAEMYNGEGLQGQSYALPTKSTPYKRLSLSEVKESVDRFIKFAHDRPGLTFFLSKVGTGYANFKEEEIIPLFKNAPDNVVFPLDWESRRHSFPSQLQPMLVGSIRIEDTSVRTLIEFLQAFDPTDIVSISDPQLLITSTTHE